MKTRKEEIERHERLTEQRIDRYFHENEQKIKNLLCSAFEGGSNYWYFVIGADYSELGLEYMHEVPFHPEGSLTIGEKDNWDMEKGEFVDKSRVTKLDRETIVRGFEKFRRDYPQHFEDWASDNDDAITGDIFLQVLVFGTDIYG